MPSSRLEPVLTVCAILKGQIVPCLTSACFFLAKLQSPCSLKERCGLYCIHMGLEVSTLAHVPASTRSGSALLLLQTPSLYGLDYQRGPYSIRCQCGGRNIGLVACWWVPVLVWQYIVYPTYRIPRNNATYGLGLNHG